jgi:DNA processing protein
MTSDRTLATVALRELAGIGPRMFSMLVLRFGPPEEILARTEAELTGVPRLTAAKAQAIRNSAFTLDELRTRLDELESRGTRAVTYFDDDYPQALREITNPPPFLYVWGTVTADATGVAVVGTHKASSEGIANAVAIGRTLAKEGVAVISGLARGIDSSGHLGALAAGGKTYAVIGSGLEKVYPPEHESLAEQIAASGAVLSEYPEDRQVSVPQLMARNRIVVGLSKAVVIVELAEKSKGTMAAAEIARKQGKPVFLVVSGRQQHADALLRAGVYPLTDVTDLSAVLACVQ